MDPKGTYFTYQAGVQKADGGQGFADVWYQGHFAWEYKGPHANLDKAYRQLLQYREALENPPLLVVSDLEKIIIHTNFTNSVKQVYSLTLDDLLKPNSLAILRSLFFNPESLKAAQTNQAVTEEAAKQFSRLAEMLRKYGEEPDRIAHFLIKLLFCLFAEDVGLLPEKLFTRLAQAARTNPPSFHSKLRQLFEAMATGGSFGVEDILHFDGHLFDDAEVLTLDTDSLAILAEVSYLDWSSIEPSIFGTLFERSLDPSKRSQLGAHYTSRDDILLIVEPVLMAPLRQQWETVQTQARDLAAKRDAAAKGQRAKFQNQLTTLLTGFAGDIAAEQVLDPACGSGNFLYVALRQLMDLEKQVITLAHELGVGSFFPSVSPKQLHGIEINEYAHQLAQATIQIGYIQWLAENGYGHPAEPILKPLDNILKMDAILGFNDGGLSFEPEWPKVDVIIGNPPFLGNKKMRTELGDVYVEQLRKQYDGRIPGGADLVAYWFEIARQMIESSKVKRVGLLATQSIRRGASHQVLERIKNSGDIFWAQSDREWVLDGAAVRVSMVAFDNGSEAIKELDGKKVGEIFSNLTSNIDLTSAVPLQENLGICFQGPIKVGPFDIDESLAQEMLAAPVNVNGRPNSDVIKPVVNATDLVQRSRRKWTIDFGMMTEEEAAFYELPYEYTKTEVKPIRMNHSGDQYNKWWQYLRPRPEMRNALKEKSRCIATPRVAKHRIFSWVSTSSLPDTRVYVFARDDDYFFGVLHSRVHEIWALSTSSRHGVGNDPTYNNTTCFETFPFPWPPGKEPMTDPSVQAIAALAKELVRLRDNWLNPEGIDKSELQRRTLTNLYNQRPTWLTTVHEKLNKAVFAAYSWPDNLRNDEILERLLFLNKSRSLG